MTYRQISSRKDKSTRPVAYSNPQILRSCAKSIRACITTLMSLALLVSAVRIGSAQQDVGYIPGTVTDQSGAAVKGATVITTRHGTEFPQTAVTNETGYYTTQHLQVGHYTVSVTMNALPLPRLVLPTASLFFWLGQSCHLETSRPASADLRRPVRPTEHATHPATRLRPATASADASKSRAKETRREEIATLLRSAESTRFPRSSYDSRPRAVPDCPSCVVVGVTTARSTPTAHPSTASAAFS